MKIIKTESAVFCEDGTTVSVECEQGGKTETFHVQTYNGKYDYQAGCWILTDTSNGEIDKDDFPAFDFLEIQEAARNFLDED